MLENSFYTNNNVDKQVFNATSSNGPFTVGQFALGGRIAYISQPGDPDYDAGLQKGYVVATADQGSGIVWGCSGTSITTGTILGTGAANTAAILAGCATRPIAASLAAAVTDGGYSDWYLPSKDELNKLYLNRAAIGGFTNNLYLSSTEYGSNYAWFQDFGFGGQNVDDKFRSYFVRAIRAF